MAFIDETIKVKCDNVDCENFNKIVGVEVKSLATEIDPEFIAVPDVYCATCGRQAVCVRQIIK